MVNYKRRIRPRKGDFSGFDLAIGPSYKTGWYRASEPKPEPDVICVNCKNGGDIWRWHLYREVFAFGNLSRQDKEVLECRNCLHERDLGTIDKPFTPQQVKTRGVNLRKLNKEQLDRLFQVMEADMKQKEQKDGQG